MGTFVVGFLSGFFANQVFGMMTRLLPSKWVRYAVMAKGLGQEEGIIGVVHSLVVTLEPPKFRKALMSPLVEDLVCEIRADNGGWLRTCWRDGDLTPPRFRADSATSIEVQVGIDQRGFFYVGDSYPKGKPLFGGFGTGCASIDVRVIRLIDRQVALQTSMQVISVNKKVTIAIR